MNHEDLRDGDIIFIATAATLFRKVARSTGSRTSHVGIIFRDPARGLMVAESAVPWSRYTPIERFIARSDDRWYAIRRLPRSLTASEVSRLRAQCDARMGILYHTGFDFDSRRQFCSKFVHEVYRDALGVEIGELETFATILARNPAQSIKFWRWWFFGMIPWHRRTVTPASQLISPMLETAWDGSRCC